MKLTTVKYFRASDDLINKIKQEMIDTKEEDEGKIIRLALNEYFLNKKIRQIASECGLDYSLMLQNYLLEVNSIYKKKESEKDETNR